MTLHTSSGDIKLEIFCDLVPKASENFLALAASNYYDGTTFHRLISGFCIQGGDPTVPPGKGGESIWGGKFADEFHKDLSFADAGMVAFANNGKDQNGSQFFITFSPQPHLDGNYTIFGQVIGQAGAGTGAGLSALEVIERLPVGKKNRPLNPLVLNSITIHANPLAVY